MTRDLDPAAGPGPAQEPAPLLGRRRALGWMGAVGVAGVLGACSDDTASSGTADGASPPTAPTSATPTSSTSSAAPASPTTAARTPAAEPGAAIPDETAGPFPADGTNGPDLLETEGVVRRDLTSSIGGRSGTAEGVPITIELRLVEATTGAPVPAAAVHLWHCTADANRTRRVSQIALPRADCEAVYGDARYGPSADHLAELSLDTDVAFRDGWTEQLATVTGTPDEGLTASLLVRV